MTYIRKHWKKVIFPLITLGMFSAITCIVVFAKAGVNDDYKNRFPIAEFRELLMNPEFNPNELTVLTMMNRDASDLIITTQSVFGSLYEQLKAYLGRSGVDLTKEKAEQARKNIVELNQIIAMEGNRDLKEMTLDAKGMATRLSQLIYQSCGLKLSFDMTGNIDKISTTDGSILFDRHKSAEQDRIHIQPLAITIGVIIILLFFCVLIARKHKLFQREELYESFDEEKYA